MNSYDLIVIGAGPSGLACAIEAKKKGLSQLVLDKGSVADAIRRFPIDMTFFSTSELLEIGGVPFTSAGSRPTRVECVRYYQMIARYFDLPVQQGVEVTGIRPHAAGFEVISPDGSLLAKNVVDATGYFDHPNRFDVPGSELSKVRRYYDEPYAYSGRNVAVIGGKNSAVETALDLFRNGARVTLIHRGPSLSQGVKYWILPDIENRIKAGDIRAMFETRVERITSGSITVGGRHHEEFSNDAVFLMIGYCPDSSLLRQAGVEIDPETQAPVHNSATMETNVRGVFVAGSIAAGRFNNKIFIENGRMHGKLIVDAIESSH
ncbi:MAG: YpdA family putative bacillithiol disulfide reductase [Ignavibacteriales bacterium]|nr:YpdA family putative bacillithiol disulfide reductase [Ignavibacteriales bacterium]